MGNNRHPTADSQNERRRSANLARTDAPAHRQRLAHLPDRKTHAVELQALNGLGLALTKHRTAAEAVFKSMLPKMEAEYPKYRTASDPETYMEYSRIRSGNLAGRIFARLLQSVIDSEFSGSRLNSMRWMVLHDPAPRHLLLTSDRPVVMTNGLEKPNGQLIIPISPRHVFIATNNQDTENYIRSVWRNRQLVQQVNERVALQSRKYVYGYSDAQLSFVSSRLGSAWTADPLENLSLDIPTRRLAE